MSAAMRAADSAGRRAQPRPEIVTLCGSMRFWPLMVQVAAQQTAAGAVALAPFMVLAGDEQDSAFKAMLDALHRHKIDLSDRVVVVTDETGYYGVSTAGEIAHARERGTPVELHRCPARPPTPRDPSKTATGEVLDAEILYELETVDLAPAAAGQDVLEAEVVGPAPYRCPLDADPVTGQYPTVLRGGRVTDLLVVERIRARAAFARLAWWRKLATRRPAGYRARWW